MTALSLHNALLRPAVLQILKANGFNYTRPVVLDTLTDLAARYMLLLASATAQNAFNNHNSYVPTVQDVRLALLEAGALRPQMSVLEEEANGLVEMNGEMVPFEDLRGIDDFVTWAQGHANKEIRRIAGYAVDGDVGDVTAELDKQEDYLTALQEKHSKSGEESRYQGTVLGKDVNEQNIAIMGGAITSLSDWAAQMRSTLPSRTISPQIEADTQDASPTTATSGISSVPATPEAEAARPDESMVDEEMAE